MSMTGKDYQALSARIRNLYMRYICGNGNAHTAAGIALAADQVAEHCALQNPNFDREKFLRNCGLSAVELEAFR